MRWPVEAPKFGRPFGWRMHPTRHVRQFHQGQDITNNTGTPLRAIADGVVYTAATVRQNPGGGNFIGIRMADGSRCRYFHMRDAPTLRVGDTVREGDVIGYLGNTGTWTTGPHLHFEVSDHKGVAQDPRAFIESRLTTSVNAPTTSTKPAPPKVPTQEELDEMAATKGAAIVRDYEYENTFGLVRVALIFPNGDARKLSDADGVTGAIEAHAKIYGILKDKDNPDVPDSRTDYTQLTSKQWEGFWKVYPGRKFGFDKNGV